MAVRVGVFTGATVSGDGPRTTRGGVRTTAD
jgi:hypothetical protein